MSTGQQHPNRLHENVDRQRHESRADEFERQTLTAPFDALKLPDDDNRCENLYRAIKPEPGESRRTGPHRGDENYDRADNIPAKCCIFEPEAAPEQ